MKDYESMTDFELNLLAARKFLDWDDLKTTPFKENQTAVAWGDGYNWYDYDPCHNWRIAGELITKNNISLNIKNLYFSNKSWVATEVTSNMNPKTADHANPCRAVLIVALMMEEENGIN